MEGVAARPGGNAVGRARASAGITFWFWRYAPQELAATLAVGAWCLLITGDDGSRVANVVGALVVEAAVFYGVVLARTVRAPLLPTNPSPLRRWLEPIAREYGLPEILDQMLRPLLMGAGACLPNHSGLGMLAGSLAADATFFAIAAHGIAHQAQFHRQKRPQQVPPVVRFRPAAGRLQAGDSKA